MGAFKSATRELTSSLRELHDLVAAMERAIESDDQEGLARLARRAAGARRRLRMHHKLHKQAAAVLVRQVSDGPPPEPGSAGRDLARTG